MKRLFLLLFSLAFALGALEEADAHGVGYIPSEKPPVALEFYYSTGEPMSFAKADVFAPGDAKGAFQSGRTDEKGRFAFVPDGEGEWRVVVTDDEGHRAEAVVAATGKEDGVAAPAAATVSGSGPAAPLDTSRNALLGVSLIFNIAAATTLYRARRRKHAHQ